MICPMAHSPIGSTSPDCGKGRTQENPQEAPILPGGFNSLKQLQTQDSICSQVNFGRMVNGASARLKRCLNISPPGG